MSGVSAERRAVPAPWRAMPAAWRSVPVVWRAQPTLVIGAVLVLGFVLAALLAPWLTAYDPIALGDLQSASYRPPSAEHWLGTDQFGRDVMARILYGARVSLGIAFLAAALGVGIGTCVGLVSGYCGGVVDGVLMRATDLWMAFPRLFLVLLVAGLLRPSTALLIVLLGVTGWMSTARLVRAQVASLRHGGWVEAARALGFGTGRILARHVLPNVAAPVLVSATLMLGNTILAESALSFLGLGVQVPAPSWGSMVEEGRKVFPAVWWVSVFPGIAITLTVVGYNLLGDALRDTLDPRWRARAAAGCHERGAARSARAAHRLRHAGRPGARCRWRVVRDRARHDARSVGRIRLRQESHRAVDPAPACRPVAASPVARSCGAGAICSGSMPNRCAACAVPKSVSCSKSRRAPSIRFSRAVIRSRKRFAPTSLAADARRASSARDALACASAGSRTHRRRLSARALGRHGTARRAGDGAGLRTEPAHRRRTDDGARRDDPSADLRSAARAASRDRYGAAAHLARSGVGGRHGRSRRDHVRRPHRRAGTD
jgi:peptide/nickel transport system permease protein